MSDISYASKSQIVTERVRALIAGGHFVPGQVLRQRELSAALGVSATPVREAFQRLEVEGYLILEDHRGARVVPTTGRLKESYLLFGVLQGLTARLACERTDPDDVARLQAILDEYHISAANQGNRDDLYAMSRRFSDELTRLAAMPMVNHMLKVRWDAHTPYHDSLSPSQEIEMSRYRVEWMASIIRALSTGDPELGENVTREFGERLYALSTQLGERCVDDET